jgi:hypothetical protein
MGFFGHIISGDGVRLDPSKVADMPIRMQGIFGVSSGLQDAIRGSLKISPRLQNQ